VKKVWLSDKEYELIPDEFEGTLEEGNLTYKGVSLTTEEVDHWATLAYEEDYLSIWKAGVDAAQAQALKAITKFGS